MPPRPHDRSYRRIFSERLPVLELLFKHCTRWIDPSKLRPETLRRLPGTHITGEGRELRQDIVWLIGYGDDGSHLVLAIEFQSGKDPNMARRVREYGHATVEALDQSGRLDAGGLAPYCLAVVIYNGRERWDPPGAFGPEGPPNGAGVARGSWSPFYSLTFGASRRQNPARTRCSSVWGGPRPPCPRRRC